MKFRLATAEVEVRLDRTITTFADGRHIQALHAPQEGQAKLAIELGYGNAKSMNRHHDLTHSLLAAWLGLPHSLTLAGVAEEQPFEHWREEEAAVLAIQRFANHLGIDLVKVAAAHSRKD